MIYASQTNPNGYKQKFCLRCIVKDFENNEYVFDVDHLIAEGNPLNCSDAL